MILNIISVFVGGGIGSSLRYLISILSSRLFDTSIWGTSLINIIGCLIMGWMFNLTSHYVNILPAHFQVGICVGLIGGFTTFSALNVEVLELIKYQRLVLALIYLGLTMILGLGCTALGYYLKSKF